MFCFKYLLLALPLLILGANAYAASMFPSSTLISIASSTPSSIVGVDLNRDANIDIAVTDSTNNRVSVLLNNGAGAFPAITSYNTGGATPVALSANRLNHDAYTDLVMANSGNSRLSLFYADASANFQLLPAATTLAGGPGYASADRYSSMATGLTPVDVMSADINGDTYTDVVAVNSGGNTVSVWLGTSAAGAGFSAPSVYAVGTAPQAAVLGDVDRNGSIDLVVANGSAISISVLLNNGAGVFNTKVDYPALTVAQQGADPAAQPRSIALGDLNGDGNPDVVVGNSGSRNISVLLGNGAGAFAAPVLVNALGSSPMAIAIADMNGDARQDIVTANLTGEVSILLGNGTGAFPGPSLNFPAGTSPAAMAIADFNKDGKPDVLTANSGSADIYIQTNQWITDTTPPNGIAIIKTTANVNSGLAGALAKDIYTTLDGIIAAVNAAPNTAPGFYDNYTNVLQVSVSYGCNDTDTGCQQMQYSVNGGGWSRWEKLPLGAYNFNITLPAGDGVKDVQLRFADGSGNVSAIVSDSITLDTIAPSGTLLIANGAAVINSYSAVSIDYNCSDAGGSGCAAVVGGFGGSVTSNPYGATNFDSNGIAKYTWNMGAINGTKTETVQFSDLAGNLSATITDSIILDTIAPAAPLIQLPATQFGNNTRPLISGTAEANSTVDLLDGISPLSQVTASATGLWSYTPAVPLAAGVHQFTATATDVAGNRGAASTSLVYVVDLVAPILTLQGASTVTLTAGTPFADPYATVQDNLSVGLVVTRTGLLDIYTAGSYTLVYHAVDQAGNAATPVQRTVIVTDVVPPVIILLGGNPYVMPQGYPYVDPGVTVTDNVNSGLTAVVSGSVNTATLGSYLLTYNATDLSGNKAIAVTRTVNVTDQTAPLITLTGGNAIALSIGAPFVDPGAVVTDNVDKNLTASVTGAVNSAVMGAYSLTYSAVDTAGNNAVPVVRTVTVGDTSPPVIGLLGNNPLVWAVGVPFADPGSTVTDNLDVGLTATAVGTVNDAVVGGYSITYNAIDNAGNAAVTVIRTVNVKDFTPPVISLLGGSPYTVAQGVTYVDPGVTVSDNVDIGLTATVSGSVNTALAGNYSLTYSATDAAGNVATKTRQVTVADTTPPVITLVGANPYSLAQGTIYVEPGVQVVDNVDGNLNALISGTVNGNVVGAYPVSYNAIDQAGNAAITVVRTVNVIDQTAPVLSLNGVNPMTLSLGAVFIDPGVTISDNVDVGLTAIVTGAVNGNAVGSYSVTYQAIDAAGNSGVVSRVVNVVDQAAPVITLLGNNPYTMNVGDLFVDPGSVVVDNLDVGLNASVSGTVNSSTPGSYSLIYQVVDSSGNSATASRTVQVVDTIVPVIILNGGAVITLPVGTVFNDPGSVVTDNVDSGLLATVSGSVNSVLPGQYLLTYQAVDLSGNNAIAVTRTVNVVDPQAPLISLNGLNPLTVAQGSLFVDPGSVVTDNIDVGLAATVSGTVDTLLVGSYVLTYNAIDNAGNAALPVIRTVNVVDKTAPVITLNGASQLSVGYDALAPFVDPGAIVTDNVDLLLAVTVKGFVNRASVGSYTLSYEARDSAGNIATATRMVQVVDQQAPVISLVGSPVISLNVGSIFTDPGSIVYDNVDLNLLATATGQVNTAVPGQYIITYSATDSAGNAAATVSRTVNVQDLSAPVISLLGSSQVSILLGSIFVDPGAVVVDNVDNTLVATVSGSVNSAVVGSYLLSYNAVDTAGNVAATVQRTVLVNNQNPPLITLLGSNPYTLAVGSPWVDPGAIVTDNLNSGLVATVTGAVNSSIPGSYVLSYNVIDTAGTAATTQSRTVIVVDAVSPVITLNGAPTMTIAQGSLYIDYGASVTDNVDVGLVPVVTGAVNSAQVGVYTLSYTAVDRAGNVAPAVTRTVTVTDQSKPVITLLGPSPYILALGAIWLDPGSQVVDNVDTALQSTVTGTVNSAVAGSYALSYNAVDLAGNIASPVMRIVNVKDLTPPVITLNGASAITIAQGSLYVDSGASVIDNVDVGLVSTVTGVVNSAQVGVYTLTYSALDRAGNAAQSITRNVTVTDQSKPVITLLGQNPYTLALGTGWVEPGAQVVDNVDKVLQATITGTVNAALAGLYTLSYNAVDSVGNVALTVTRTVNVKDLTPPVITLNGASAITIAQGSLYVDSGASVTDNVDVGLVATVTGVVNSAQVGVYTLSYSALDTAGNAAQVITRTVTVTDQTKPVITLLGQSPYTLALGTGWVDPGVQVIDNVDNSLQASITGTVNTTLIGSYILSYNAVDSAGNVALTVTRIVNVKDLTPPVITLNGASAITIAQGSLYVDSGASVTDNVDVGLVATITGAVNSAQLGVYTLSYSALDTAGNAAQVITRTVTVTDQTKPVITLLGQSPYTLALGTGWVEPGAQVVDNVDKALQATITGTVNTTLIGSYILSYNAVDSAGNVALTVTRTVNVKDLTPPVITLNGASAITIAQGSLYVDSGASVTDNVDVGLVATVTGAVNSAQVGVYTLSYSVLDTAGNAAQVITRTVTVTDQTKPVISLIGGAVMTIGTGTQFIDPGTVVTDNVDLALVATATGLVNTAVVGSYTITYSVSDSSNNAALPVVRTVNVSSDLIAPTVMAPAPIVVAALQPGGTPVTNAQIANFLASATASDNIGVVGPITHNAPTITFPVGTTTVTFTALDAAGNSGSASATVTVNGYVDVTPPVLSIPASIVLYSVNPAGMSASDTAIINFLAAATATDDVAVVGGVTNNAVTTFPLGVTSVSFSAMDAAGNSSTASANVTVVANQNPVAISNSAVGVAGSVVQISNVLANDYDPDGNPLSVISVDAYSIAMGIIVDLYAGNFSYTPQAGFSGMDSFNYSISDGLGGTASGVVKISITPNLAPLPIFGNTPPVLLRNGNNGVIMQINSTKILTAFAVNNLTTNADAYTYSVAVTPPAIAYSAIQSATFGVPSASRLTISAGPTSGTDIIQVTVRDPVTGLTASLPLIVTIQNPNVGGNTAAPAADGLTTAQKINAGLNLLSVDTDGDGIPDSQELGDPNNPSDTDSDGVIDALEPGINSEDPSRALGMLDQSGTTSIGIVGLGNTLANVGLTQAPASASKPAGISLEMITYEAHLPVNIYTAVNRFLFSAAILQPLKLFKVSYASLYTEIPPFNTTVPGEGWTLIDANTIELSLKDGGQFDLDGLQNGVVVDPLAFVQGTVVVTPKPVPVPAPAPAPAAAGGGGGKGGGCTIAAAGTVDPTLLLLLLLVFANVFRCKLKQQRRL